MYPYEAHTVYSTTMYQARNKNYALTAQYLEENIQYSNCMCVILPCIMEAIQIKGTDR